MASLKENAVEKYFSSVIKGAVVRVPDEAYFNSKDEYESSLGATMNLFDYYRLSVLLISGSNSPSQHLQ